MYILMYNINIVDTIVYYTWKMLEEKIPRFFITLIFCLYEKMGVH